jgi:hypothetical protein
MHPPGRPEIVNPEKAEIVYDGPGEPALKLLMPVRQACPFRKSNPDVLMVQTSEVWGGHDTANDLHSTRRWCILVQR